VNDHGVNDNVAPEEMKAVSKAQIGASVFAYSRNEMAYLFNEDGKHRLKKYTRDNSRASCLCRSSETD